MTDNSREIEEKIKALRPKLLPTIAEMDLYEREVIKVVHQQLQKAREEERERALNAVAGWMDDAQWYEIKDRIIEALNQSELDQEWSS